MNGLSVTMADGTEKVLYVPTPHQQLFHERTEPNVLFYGGRGSGKSTALRFEAHARALMYPGFKYVILRRTYPELLKSHLMSVPQEMQLFGGTFHHGDKRARYPNGSIGFFSHCQNDQDVLNLLSAEFYWAGFDEISTFPWENFVKLAASVRVPVGTGLTAMVRAATNPFGASAEMINRYWVLKDIQLDEDEYYNPNDWYSIKANAEDNPHLDVEQYKSRFSGLSDTLRKAWVEGEFSVENALFGFFPTINKKPYHVVKEMDLAKVLQNCVIYRAMDAGWYPDPTVCLWIAHLGKRHIVIHERQWLRTTAADIAAEIKEEDKRLAAVVGPNFQLRVAMTYCDPSMDINTTADVRTIKEIYEDNGIPMENSINKRDHFAMAMHQALAEQADENTPRIQFYSDPYKRFGCPNLIKTIPQMRYKLLDPKFMDDHTHDHWVVACCYYLLSHSADLRNEISYGGNKPKWMMHKPGDRFILGSDQVRRRY